MGTGDFLAQTVIEKQKLSQLDYIRTLKFFSIGFCVAVSFYFFFFLLEWNFRCISILLQSFCLVSFLFQKGPGLRKWYGALDARCTATTRFGRTMQKVFIDQVVFAPFFLGCLLSLIGYSQHQDVEKVKEKLRHDYTDILVANYSLWPWVQIINFSLVPLNYQVLLTQTVAVFWNIYFSWRTNLKERHPSVTNVSSSVSSGTTTANSNAITAMWQASPCSGGKSK